MIAHGARRAKALLTLGLVSALCAGTGGAQAPGMENKAFMDAAMAVMSVDAWLERCATRGGLAPSDSAALTTWRTNQGADLVRQRLTALEGATPPDKRVGQARSMVQAMVKIPLGSPCNSAMALVRNARNQFATVHPDLIAALRPASVPAPVVAVPAEQGAAASPSPSPAPTVEPNPAREALVSEIESFGFAAGTAMGVGGFLTTRIYPVVLFRNGDALRDAEGLSAPGGLAQHRRQHPDDWTRWRRQGGEIQLQSREGWEALPFKTTYPRLPDGFRLDGLFRHLGGTGTEGIGGDQSVAAWNEYRFWPDGRVERGGGASARTGVGSGSVVTASVAPERRGRYRVQGLELIVSWDNGMTERRVLIADPNDPKTALWLDGVGYVRREPRR